MKREHIADLVALLMQQPRTKQELYSLLEYDQQCIKAWISALHDAGVLYILEWRKNPFGGAWFPVYKFQSYPFQTEDALCPSPKKHKSNPKNLIKDHEALLFSQLLTGKQPDLPKETDYEDSEL